MARIVFSSAAFLGDVAPFVEPANRHAASRRDVPDAVRLPHYLDDGDPPVLICLGTSAAVGAGEALATMAADLRSRGVRPLVLAGESANLEHLPNEPGAFEFAPIHHIVHRCAAAVEELSTDPNYSRRASELAEKLRTEDGASALVDAICDTL